MLHHGAKVRNDTVLRKTIKDPGKLLRWASADRAILTLTSETKFEEIRDQFASIVKQWVAYQRLLAVDQ